MWSNGNAHSSLMGMQSGTATLEGTAVVSGKTKYTLTMQCSNHAPCYLPKGVKNLGPHRNLLVDAYSSFTLNCQKLEATRMSFSRGMAKYTAVHPDGGLLFNTKKK